MRIVSFMLTDERNESFLFISDKFVAWFTFGLKICCIARVATRIAELTLEVFRPEFSKPGIPAVDYSVAFDYIAILGRA